ncbi:MAG: sensor histidine kinase [Bdellovibrio sp.]
MNTQRDSTEAKVDTSLTRPFAGEKKALVILVPLFALVLLTSWGFALHLQQKISLNKNMIQADPTALVEVERLRNLADSQIDDSRAYFLLGSQALFDRQKNEQAELITALNRFEANYSIDKVPGHIQDIRALLQKNQEFFEQGIDFREKKTESKIVGQFYQAKTSSIRNDINKALDSITKLYQAHIANRQAEIHDAAKGAEMQIPLGMTWITISTAAIFFVLSYLVIRLVRRQEFQLSQQNRLYEEAKRAIEDRDDAIFSISHDLKDSLRLISMTAERMTESVQGLNMIESGELVKSTVTTIEGVIQDIRDRKNLEIDGMTLRLDQLAIDQVLDTARLLMQPLAKQYDVRLQVDSVNPPVLAFYDNDRILRVLANLIGNAIKFSEKGEKVVVKVRSDQKFVNISIVDSGPGIPTKHLDGIFENFWQAKKTADQGAGLGLAIVKNIIDAHGGTVEMQSNSGQGTTVTFSLPRRRPVGASLKKSAITVRQSVPSAFV